MSRTATAARFIRATWSLAFATAFIALVFAGAAIPLACSDPLEPAYILDRPRILAIRAEPPALVPGESVTLDALVYAPPNAAPAEYEWSWCASRGSTLQCTTSATDLAALLNAADAAVDAGDDADRAPTDPGPIAVTYAIGKGERVDFRYPVPPHVVDAACAAFRPPPPPELDAGDAGADADASDAGDAMDASDSGDSGTLSGLPLNCGRDTWTLYVMLTVKVGGRTLQATRDLTAYFDAPSVSNENPVVLGLEPFTRPLPSIEAGPDEETDASAGADADVASDADAVDAENLYVYASATEGVDGAAVDAAVGTTIAEATVIAAAVPKSASEIVDPSARDDDDDPTAPDAGGDAAADSGIDASAEDGGGLLPPKDGGPPDRDGGIDPPGDGGGGNLSGGGPNPPKTYEALTLSWYVEGGTLAKETTTLSTARVDVGGRDWNSFLVNRWVPPDTRPREFILVIRDTRGGIGWVRQRTPQR